MTPGRKFPPRKQTRRENVNETIRAREVRAVFPDGETEIMSTAAALRKAQDMGLDLVLIAPTAVPPVAKAIDYGHYQYEQKKKLHDFDVRAVSKEAALAEMKAYFSDYTFLGSWAAAQAKLNPAGG